MSILYQLEPRHEPTIDLWEGDCPLSFTRSDLVRYAGPDQIIATALMFQIFRCAFAQLAPEGKLQRNEVSMQIGFPGPGVVDCTELVLRGRTRNEINVTVKTKDLPLEAPEALVGRFYFEFEYEGKRIGLWPVDGFFTDEFRNMVTQFQPRKGSEQEQAAFQAFKQDMIGRLMGTEPNKLFHLKQIS